jgi:hypothetical protein
MCDGINFEDGTYCETQGQLKAKLGNIVKYYDGVDNALEDVSCLCPVNFIKTAELHGYYISKNDPKGEFDAFDTWFYKQTKHNPTQEQGE